MDISLFPEFIAFTLIETRSSILCRSMKVKWEKVNYRVSKIILCIAHGFHLVAGSSNDVLLWSFYYG